MRVAVNYNDVPVTVDFDYERPAIEMGEHDITDMLKSTVYAEIIDLAKELIRLDSIGDAA